MRTTTVKSGDYSSNKKVEIAAWAPYASIIIAMKVQDEMPIELTVKRYVRRQPATCTL